MCSPRGGGGENIQEASVISRGKRKQRAGLGMPGKIGTRTVWQDCQKIISDMSDHLGFLKISRGDSGTSFGYPPSSLAICTVRKFFLISSLKCVRGPASEAKLLVGTTASPHSLCDSEGGMGHMSCCLVEATITLTSMPIGPRGSRMGLGLVAGRSSATETSRYQVLLPSILCMSPGREGIVMTRPGMSLTTMCKY